MDLPVERLSRMVVLVDTTVWALVDRETVVAMVGATFDVVDHPIASPLVAGALLVTTSTDTAALSGFRAAGIVGVISVIGRVPEANRSGAVTAVLQAGADYGLVKPEPAEVAAHVRAMTRRLRPD